MPRANALVDDVHQVVPTPSAEAGAGISAPTAQLVEVRFQGGRSGMLDLSDYRSAVWRDVLQSLHESGRPAYVEIEPQSGLITELLLPARYQVGRLTDVEDGLEVELVVSHARHYLRRSNPDFDELREELQTALNRRTLALVTETLNEHEIIDVRVLDEPAELGPVK